MTTDDESITELVAHALHCWSCPLCYTNGPDAMANSDQDHVTQSDRLQAVFLIGALGLTEAGPK